MRSSAILASCFGAVALATPLRHVHNHAKKAVVYDVVTEVDVVTVVAEAAPTTSEEAVHIVVVTQTAWVNAPAEPEATTAAPVPSTTEVPVVVVTVDPTTSSSAAPEVVVVTVEPSTTAAIVQAAAVEASSTTAQAAATAAAETASYATGSALTVESDSTASTTHHTTARSKHSASEMTWNATLAEYAAQLASTCVFKHDQTIGGGGYGQNIAAQGSSDASAWTTATALENAIIDEWYSEESIFASASLYGVNSPSESAGDWTHFTQVVWKASHTAGCAVAKCPTSNSIFNGMYTWYTVCNYWPVGNVVGSFAANVASS